MPSPHLQIPDIQTNQPGQEAVGNDQVARLDRAMNQAEAIVVTGSFQLTTTQQRQRALIILELGSLNDPSFTMDMADNKARFMIVVNRTGAECTVRNSVGAGGGQPVIPGTSPQAVSIFQYNGTDFIELFAFP